MLCRTLIVGKWISRHYPRPRAMMLLLFCLRFKQPGGLLGQEGHSKDGEEVEPVMPVVQGKQK